MSKRDVAITAAKVAGYHDDGRMFTRLIIESRVSRPVMNKAWVAGQAAKQAGVKCACYDCSKGVSA